MSACSKALSFDARKRDMTSKEIGAPNEVFADIYAATGNARYLDLAKKLVKEPMVAALENGDRSALFGHHANTEIPLYFGYQRTHEVTGENRWHQAAGNFWDAVTSAQTFACGGNSIWEAFIQPADYEKKLMEDCGPETCNTYDFLKLTRQLNEQSPQSKYTDYIERAMFNQILTTIGPAPENGFAYYRSTRPGHYKRYSKPFDAFWCRVGSGMENHARYGSYIDSAQNDRLMVNHFIPSQIQWKDQTVDLRQTTGFSNDDRTNFAIKTGKPTKFTLSIRCPAWAYKSKLAMQLNGKRDTPVVNADDWIDLQRIWNDGDIFKIKLPSRLTAEFTPSGKFVAFYHGPVLLATADGKEGLMPADSHPDGSEPFIQLGRKELPAAKVPSINAGKSNALSLVGETAPHEIRYSLQTTLGPKDLIPFCNIGLERYSIYFPLSP